ncbi:MAG: 30S ribosomal protein S8 [Candidatus Aenigmarchaeota archaeon]|nr:30S ribosomal protein S8 [Candidatus Aenigmarchaeota archaeon]
MRHDILTDVMYSLNNAEKNGKKTCVVPASKTVKNVLAVMQGAGYIGAFDFIDDGKSGFFEVKLVGKINESRGIRPRFAVKKDEYEKWEKRFLPARGFGMLIISTSKGLMDQKQAGEKRLGGRLMGYVY